MEKRKRWIKLLKRENRDKTEWKPAGSDRVCSEHFVDKIPTEANPDPTICLGYNLPKTSSRRTLFRHPLPERSQPTFQSAPFLSPPSSPNNSTDNISTSPMFTPPADDHQYCRNSDKTQCLACFDKGQLIKSSTKKSHCYHWRIKS